MSGGPTFRVKVDALAPFEQSERQWLDLGDHADATFWVDCGDGADSPVAADASLDAPPGRSTQ